MARSLNPSAAPLRHGPVNDAWARELLVAQDDKKPLALMILMKSAARCPAGPNGSERQHGETSP